MASIEQFLKGYDEQIATLADALRRFVKGHAPEAREQLQDGWQCITYSHRKAFCSIMPHGSWVNLQFHAGAILPDPRSLLRGTGKMMRHVRVQRLEDLGEDLGALVQRAAELSR